MPKRTETDDVITIEFTEEESERAEAAWTDEDMARAKPEEFPPPPKAPSHPDQDDRPRDRPRIVLPSSDGIPEMPEATPTEANVKERPFWNCGKLFYKKQVGSSWESYSGSAAFVGSDQVLLTAAHCLFNSDQVAVKDLVFRRAYNNGGGQKVSTKKFCIYKAYFTEGTAYDYGFVKTSTRSGAGWLGLALGCPYDAWWSLGYPSNYSDGKRQFKVYAPKGWVSNNQVQMKDNTFWKGASGGPWVGDLTTPHTGGNYAIGVNATSDTANIYGPLFNDSTYQLYQHVAAAAELAAI